MPPSIVKGTKPLEEETKSWFGFSRPASKDKQSGIAKPKTSAYNTAKSESKNKALGLQGSAEGNKTISKFAMYSSSQPKN